MCQTVQHIQCSAYKNESRVQEGLYLGLNCMQSSKQKMHSPERVRLLWKAIEEDLSCDFSTLFAEREHIHQCCLAGTYEQIKMHLAKHNSNKYKMFVHTNQSYPSVLSSSPMQSNQILPLATQAYLSRWMLSQCNEYP